MQALHCRDILSFCRDTDDTGTKGTSPALPFSGQSVPALPCKGADRALLGNVQGCCHSSWTVSDSPTGHGTYTGPLAAYLETAHGPVQNSPNGCCISPHQHEAAENRPQKQASHDSPVQKRASMSPYSSDTETQSTRTGFRAAHSSRNKQRHLRPAITGSRTALQNSTGVFQTPPQGIQITTAGPSFPQAHDPCLMALSSSPRGHSQLPFPIGPIEASCANGDFQPPAQAGQLKGSRAVPNSLECRLVFPHGSRSHKLPKLEDRLKEVSICFTLTQLTAQ